MRRAASIALACALALTACGGQSPGRATRQHGGRAEGRLARSSSPRAAASSSRTGANTNPRPAVTVAAGQPYVPIAAFRSPHGEIACAIDSAAVRCAISHPQWAGRSPCPTARTQVLLLARRGQGRFDCARGAAPAGGVAVKALPYGTIAVLDGFLCESYTGGVQCATDHNGHGFFISPPLVRLF